MSDTNHADFTPVIPDSSVTPEKATYAPVGSFKFWAQKVLPTVYDDSLSYYEVLTKLVWHINKMIEDMDNFNTTIDSTLQAFNATQEYVNSVKDTMIATYNKLQDYVNHYFDNLDVQDEINHKLDALAVDGTLSNLLAPYIPDLVTSWLNENVTPVGSAVVVDESLTVAGAAADAKKTGLIKHAVKVMNNLGNLDFFGGDATFYDGYYDGRTYTGKGTPIDAPYNSWCTIVVHVIKGATIELSGFPTNAGAASIWLNSNDKSDVYGNGWGSSENNGSHVCSTEWLAISAYQPDEINLSIKYKMLDDVKNYIDKFVDDNFTYDEQLLDPYNDRILGRYYYPNNTRTGTNERFCIYPPIKLKANQTYTLHNIRTVFTTYKVGETVTSIEPDDAGSTDKTVVFTPTNDGYLYVTGSKEVWNMVFVGEYDQSVYDYGKFNYKIKNDSFGEDVITSDKVSYLKKCYQYLNHENTESGYYNINSSNKIYVGTGDTLHFNKIKLKGGVTYKFTNCIGYFCIIGDFAGNAIERVTENTDNSWSGYYTPDADCYLYATVAISHLYHCAITNDLTYQPVGYVYGNYYTYMSEQLITEESCSFFKICEQYLHETETQNGYWNIGSNNNIYLGSGGNAVAFNRFKIKKGETYHFYNCYGYFCILVNENGNAIGRITDDNNTVWTGNYIATQDCYLYVTVAQGRVGEAMVTNDAEHMPTSYIEGVYEKIFLYTNNDELNIHVKTDGSGEYNSVVDAVDFANNNLRAKTINIYIHSGDYNLLTELGGNDFLASVLESPDERQGLCLKRDNINLIGVGNVTLRYELPDNVEYYQSSRTSCLNLREFSNRIENLTLIAKNCRYTIHDETNGGNPHIHRVMKNLRCIHKGNAEGLWRWATVMGGGAGGGSTYDIINCQFITNNYKQAFSYHTNNNEEQSFFNVDGCVGVVNNSEGNSFRFSYHGTGRVGTCVANVKCCSGNGLVVVEPETSGDTGNNIELYKNGWETISPIIIDPNI